MKWNYGKTGEGYGYDNLPPIGEEVLAVFEGMAEFVWQAKLNGAGEWVGCCLDNEGVQKIASALICWKPWPKSPFKEQ